MPRSLLVDQPLIPGQNANAEFVFDGKKVGTTYVGCAIVGVDVKTGLPVGATSLTTIRVNR